MQALLTFSQKRYEIILKSNLPFGHQSGLFKSISLYWYPLPISGVTTLKALLFKRVPDWGPEQRESKLTVHCLLIIIILSSYIIIYYIIIKLLIMGNHPSQNWKWNPDIFWRSCLLFLKMDVKESVLNHFKINLNLQCQKWLMIKFYLFILFLFQGYKYDAGLV